MRKIFVYDSNGDKVLIANDIFVSRPEIKYDSVVDRSQFRPDSENVRNFGLSGAGSGSQGSFDSPDREPSDLEVRIRSGKLDKAEVGIVLKQLSESYQKENESAIKAKKQKELQAIADSRQEYLDKVTGFSGVPQGNVQGA